MLSPLRSTIATLVLPVAAVAQDSSVTRLPTVQVTVTREVARSPLELPYAISVTAPDSLRPGLRRLALDEMLALLPGIAVANRNNPTQDPRITIRGFGSRSAFGVRGVRVLRDGIPLTLPDGQTPVDYLDLESIESIEVIRGTASALYGNAAGGVVDLRSAPPPLAPVGGRARYIGGTYGLQRWHTTVGGTSEPWGYQASITRTENDGFRRYSEQRTTHVVAGATVDRGAARWSVQAIGFDMPVSENPGALTAAEVSADPRGEDPRSRPKRARKDVQQGQLAVAYSRTGTDLDLSASLYGGIRDLYNPLPFGIIGVDRKSYGASVQGRTAADLGGKPHRLTFGLDAQYQDDDRVEYANCNNPAGPPPLDPPTACDAPVGERGDLARSQIERVTGLGPYIRDEVDLTEAIALSLGVRGDFVTFDVDDRLDGDGDDSGQETMTQLSPMVGLVARVGVLTSLYATISSAFETPTATEMGNKPDGSGGLNPVLEPQKSMTYELGMKGGLSSSVMYDAAVFLTDVRDELIPFEAGTGGRRFFRNAGRTERRGAELGLRAERGPFRAGVAYSWSDFEFEDYALDETTRFDGNSIPGVPEHQGQASLSWVGALATATVEGLAVSRVPVDDANTTYASGYELMNARLTGSVVLGGTRFAPVVGVQNVFDRRYVGAVVANAAGGRFYEPAPGRTWFLGTSVELGRR
jgi:iron complex outermembrane receptor protein